MKAVLNTDGGARGNPGPAAIGVVLRIQEQPSPVTVREFIGRTTNNIAEYRALLRGLEEARKRGVTELLCRLDSELVVKQLNREYRVRDSRLAELVARIVDLLPSFRSVRFVAVPRSENLEADRLVNAALNTEERKNRRQES